MAECLVYLFTGFLESGKTTLIQETLKDDGFNTGDEKTLILLCEGRRSLLYETGWQNKYMPPLYLSMIQKN